MILPQCPRVVPEGTGEGEGRGHAEIELTTASLSSIQDVPNKGTMRYKLQAITGPEFIASHRLREYEMKKNAFSSLLQAGERNFCIIFMQPVGSNKSHPSMLM